jgi:toxin ParE1/3/4
VDYKIDWTLRARDDLKSIAAYVSRDKPEAAIKLGDAIFKRVDMLEKFPFMGRMVPERRQNEWRELIYKSYRVVYRVKESEKAVQIIRVWHAARGEPDLTF